MQYILHKMLSIYQKKEKFLAFGRVIVGKRHLLSNRIPNIIQQIAAKFVNKDLITPPLFTDS